ncbi:PRC-barrel domain-containing protein [Paenirhodobacter populi]|uniref:PRC-barrel domain containing protein n=1 Tax=Paenirhodobacter populi TaxID=2306993 RepID=A0A443KER3_9RHOB|nr:PRC-barrel domain-containing protein [Sinirhodobacter populi]RWR10115.1 PRC-barrel domain containing protein [Sinirhodobacter populi]RWR11990.1 PRC-barrel domain containing protein [Sinirhodobacter populi]RWR21914.1 PRC-barrel domain containing protein [Sinirhodobacter populi]RWR30212.1 PRC-barrel domain containing protein [Sinirhodobacter populi]RWR31280.1 PRC-barrel domain containing protein [Sinirhodobacter populi]
MQTEATLPPTGADISVDSSLISGKTIQGTKVFSPAGDELGHIEDIMIDAASGKVVYGILQFGGFFGIGSDTHPIPFGRLRYDSGLHGYVTDLTQADLEGAPPAADTWRSDRDWEKRTYDYYGLPPYWI